MVIHHLADQLNRGSLASLLRVNKYFQSATLPIMYENPYRFLTLDRYHGDRYARDATGVVKLAGLLLRSLPNDQNVTNLLRAAYLPDPAARQDDNQLPTESTFIPYYSFVTTIDFQLLAYPGYRIVSEEAAASRASFHRYLEEHEYVRRYFLEEVTFRLHIISEQEFVSSVACRNLRRDFNWVLCDVNAERIQSLVILISHISRYLALVDRFKLLSSVTFLLDRYFIGIEPHLQEDQESMAKQKVERTQHLEEMLSFVQEHRRLFPNVLATGYCHGYENKMVGPFDNGCPKEYQLQLLQSFPPLVKPRFIDNSNGAQFVTKIQDTDLSLVKDISIKNRRGMDKFWDQLLAEPPFLHRCRSLETISLSSISDDTFRWAVDERKQQDAAITAGQPTRQPLVPFRCLDVNYGYASLGREINDILYAFNETHETLGIQLRRVYEEEVFDFDKFSIGRDDCSWELPRLTRLSVDASLARLRIHPNLLRRCHRLETIDIQDTPDGEYSLDGIVYWKPAVLSYLVTLRITGICAASFSPVILRHAPELCFLELGISTNGDVCFIPPAEEFADAEQGETTNKINNINDDDNLSTSLSGRRPIWTRDWHLPKLTSLLLNGEFAYRFQLRILDGAPNIANLMGSEDEEREEFEIWRDFEFVHAPALKSFDLIGAWRMDVHVLDVLFGKVMPGIEDMAMSRCYGYSAVEWVRSTSQRLHGLVDACMQVTDEMLEEAGLKKELHARRANWYTLVTPPEGRTLPQPVRYRFN